MGNSAPMSGDETQEPKNTVKGESLPLNEKNVDNIESDQKTVDHR